MSVVLPPTRFYQAVEEFNSRRFFECHETLEDLWNEEQGEVRRFYQGILQIGVGYYKIITRPNYRGALSLLQSGIALLQPFAPHQFEVAVVPLIEATRLARQELERLGPDRLNEFEPALIPLIMLVSSG